MQLNQHVFLQVGKIENEREKFLFSHFWSFPTAVTWLRGMDFLEDVTCLKISPKILQKIIIFSNGLPSPESKIKWDTKQ